MAFQIQPLIEKIQKKNSNTSKENIFSTAVYAINIEIFILSSEVHIISKYFKRK